MESATKRIVPLFGLLIVITAIWLLIYDYRDRNNGLGAGLKEVSMYYEDINDQKYFKISKGGEIEITADEYKNIELKQGEYAVRRPTKKLTTLKDGEFYKTGNTDAGSTTPEIVSKQSGVESIKMLNQL